MIPKFIQHYQNKVDEILVLHSINPWNGEDDGKDKTANIARSLGATVVSYDWRNEEEQRNAGQEYLADYDWILIIDPDEYIDDDNWLSLLDTLETTEANALVVEGQHTLWKDGYVAEPARDYQMLIAVRPTVRFVDKRVIAGGYDVAPVWLWHFSWAKTDQEVWDKISHYAHAEDFDIKEWYEKIWLNWQPGLTDVHPVTPSTLHELVKVKLPKEIEKLDLWP